MEPAQMYLKVSVRAGRSGGHRLKMRLEVDDSHLQICVNTFGKHV